MRRSNRIAQISNLQSTKQIQRVIVVNYPEQFVFIDKNSSNKKFLNINQLKHHETFALEDGTFIKLYIRHDHDRDEEPWYILNVYATNLCLDMSREEYEQLLDCEKIRKHINGTVLLIRVDEDGQEMSIDNEILKQLNSFSCK